MKNERWHKYLDHLGLSESETEVYLAALREGEQTVLQLSKKTKLSRVTVYSVIETLQEKRLMSRVQKGKRQFFTAEPPERLISVAEQKMTDMEMTIKEMKAHLQELKLVQGGDKPVVKIFEGKEAFQAIADDVLASGVESFREFANLDEVNRVYTPEDLKPFQDELKRRRVKREIVYVTNGVSDLTCDKSVPNLVKFLTPTTYFKESFFGNVFFYDNKVWLSSFRGKHISVLVESETITKTVNQLFEVLWQRLKTEI